MAGDPTAAFLLRFYPFPHCRNSQTAAGQKYLGQTKRARRRTARRGLQVVVVAGCQYAVLDWLTVAGVLVGVDGAARERLQALIQRLQAALGAGPV